MKVKGILISSVAVFENHIANGGEKLLGNASSIKRRPDGRVYVSGQMQRHVLFSTIDRLNRDAVDAGDTFVSNGDGISTMIERDIRADLGGFMHPSKGDYSGRRTAPLSVTPAVALSPSEVGRDLLIRIKQASNSDNDQNQALATREYSEQDFMHMNFFLDIANTGISKAFKYENKFHINTKFFKHVNEEERRRRVKLFIEATRSMNDYANQARNAVSGEPQRVLIVLDPKMSRKASRFFTAEEVEQKNILKELEARGAKYFFGDDTQGDMSVYDAYEAALTFFEQNCELYDPSEKDSEGNDIITTFAEAFGGE